MIFKKTGYDTKNLPTNVALGVLDSVDSAIWSYTYATIIFSGALSVFLPVGIFVILVGWALLSLFVILTSELEINIASTDEQAIVILGTIGTLLVADFGPHASSSEGLATMLAVIGVTSISVSASFFLIGSLRISRLLELIPYPVICGFMVGIAWILLDTGIFVAADASISPELPAALGQGNNLAKLALSAGGGAALLWFINRIEKPWALPAAAVGFIGGFYAIVGLTGATQEELIAGGWLFDIEADTGGIGGFLRNLAFDQVDVGFIVSVLPQIATMTFLIMLGAAINISTLAAINFRTRINSTDEIRILSGSNLLCAFICSPPGYTDAVVSSFFRDLGASSRWMPLTNSLMLLIFSVAGFGLIGYMPTIFVGAMIFLFTFRMFREWLYESMRKFGIVDYLIICFILLTVITFGLVEGILVGILVTAVLFVLRYSMISAIQDQTTVADNRSSVERSASGNQTLDRHGGEARVFTLRGFLFFGTANAVRDAVSRAVDEGAYSTILLDLRRVTGIDISALQTFGQIRNLCEANGIVLLYSCVPDESLDMIRVLDAVSVRDGKPLIFAETDFAIEDMEETILAKYGRKTVTGSVYDHLVDIIGSEEKARRILDLMERVEISPGEFLFRQDDSDNGFYMLETGSLSASIADGKGGSIRVKKFSPGSIIGELSSYTADRKRTATVAADEPSVLYHLDAARLEAGTPDMAEALSAIHELVARTLSMRIDFMNRRLIKEMG